MSFVVLGYAAAEARSKMRKSMTALASRLGELSGLDIGLAPASSYEKLAQYVDRGDVDFAWLSPISLVSLTRMRRVRPLVSLHRRAVHYRCALLISATSHMSVFEELRGKRAAWVDRHSASGYALARIELATHGIGPRDLGGERFYGSHEAVVRAVASGRADFGGTFAHVTENGSVRGAWSRVAGLARSVRVMTTFGEVPPDAIATRSGLDPFVCDRLARAFQKLPETDDDRALAREAFGADDFRSPARSTYEPLRIAVFRAYRQGLLDSDATIDDATLDAAATLEQRVPAGATRTGKSPHDTPTRRKLPSGPRADDTEKMAAIDFDPIKKPRA